MGTALPVGVVKALQNRRAQLEGLTAHIPAAYLSSGLSMGSCPGLVNVVGSGELGCW